MMRGKVIALLLAAMSLPVWSQGVDMPDKDILAKSDARLYPKEGSYQMIVAEMSGSTRQYVMQVYKRANGDQTMVWAQPAVMKNTVAIRSGDTIYFKPLKATKPDIMSYQAVFMDSGFAWGDVIATDMAEDYKAAKVERVTEGGTDCFLLQVSPIKKNRYARIDILIDAKSFLTKRRVYYSVSGDKIKEANFSAFTEEGGVVTGFRVDIEDFFMGTKSYGVISVIKKESLPAFVFDVANISRIHVK